VLFCADSSTFFFFDFMMVRTRKMVAVPITNMTAIILNLLDFMEAVALEAARDDDDDDVVVAVTSGMDVDARRDMFTFSKIN